MFKRTPRDSRARRHASRVRRVARLVLIAGGVIMGCAQEPLRPRVAVLPPDYVLMSRVGNFDVQQSAPGCSLQTLEQTPTSIFRDLGSIELAGSIPAGTDVLTAVDQKACESGADAVLIRRREQHLVDDRVEYHVIAEALLLHRPKTAKITGRRASGQSNIYSPKPASSADPAATNEGAPPEALMQPVGPDDNGLPVALPASVATTAITESPIAPTDASPLSEPLAVLAVPTASSSIGAAPAESAESMPSLSATVMPTASVGATPGATASPVPPEASPTSSPTPNASNDSATPADSAAGPTESPASLPAD